MTPVAVPSGYSPREGDGSPRLVDWSIPGDASYRTIRLFTITVGWDKWDKWDKWDLWDFWDEWDKWDLWDLWDLWDEWEEWEEWEED